MLNEPWSAMWQYQYKLNFITSADTSNISSKSSSLSSSPCILNHMTPHLSYPPICHVRRSPWSPSLPAASSPIAIRVDTSAHNLNVQSLNNSRVAVINMQSWGDYEEFGSLGERPDGDGEAWWGEYMPPYRILARGPGEGSRRGETARREEEDGGAAQTNKYRAATARSRYNRHQQIQHRAATWAGAVVFMSRSRWFRFSLEHPWGTCPSPPALASPSPSLSS